MRFLLLLFVLLPALVCAAGTVPPSVSAELRRSGIPLDAVAIDVRPAEGGKALLALNNGRAFKPASVMKLLTTQAALELLGPDYRWVTRVHAQGVIEADVLRGDLLIEGSGDPRFAHEDLWRLLTRLRALGLAALKRSSAAPEIPTISEQGVTGFEVGSWYGLLAPANTPREIVTRLHAEMVKALATPEISASIKSVGTEPLGNTPEDFAAQIRNDLAKWGKVARAANMRVE